MTSTSCSGYFQQVSKTNYTSPVDSIYRINNGNDNKVAVCIRQGNKISGYEYTKGAWIPTWRHTILQADGQHTSSLYPWLATDVLGDGKDEIIIRDTEGVKFYRVVPGRLHLLAHDTQFHDVSGIKNGTFIWGRFYPNAALVGVITRNRQNIPKFYSVRKDRVLGNKQYPVWEMQKKLAFSPAWTSPDSHFFLTNLVNNGQETIALRTSEGLEFYQFNSKYTLDKVGSASQISRHADNSHDHIFFGNVTFGAFQDILHLNESGLFLFQYNPNAADYQFINHNQEFTLSYGWMPSWTESIKLFDLNGDGKDDLLFTGAKGLTALAFDTRANTWTILMDPSQVAGVARFSSPVGILAKTPPTISEPILFTQDADGGLYWAKINCNEVAFASTSNISSIEPQVTTSRPTSVRSAIILNQISRNILSEAPAVRWVEQWGENLLKEAVHPGSGQVRLNVPLVDISAFTAGKLQIVLSYNSQDTASDLVGLGWSIGLPLDFIYVDHQASVFSDSARYYVVAQGRPNLLKFVEKTQDHTLFKLKEAEGDGEKIKYFHSEERWVIEGDVEEITYGKADGQVAEDAVQWSLGWPNWHGSGTNKAEIKSFPIAWYVNRRTDRFSQRSLYYHYDMDNVTLSGSTMTYTAGVRLKSITDGDEMQIDFQYGIKNSPEYTNPNPIDMDGTISFPVRLVQSHYLQSSKLSTPTYSQELIYAYSVTDEERILIGIKQKFGSFSESIFQFGYNNLQGRQVLTKSALLPRELEANFAYAFISPLPTQKDIVSYPVRDFPKLAYGSDYGIVATREADGTQIHFRIIDRDMTQIRKDISLELPSKVLDYAIRAFKNSFFVISQTEANLNMYMFTRENDEWSDRHIKREFGKNTLVQFSQDFVVVAETSRNGLTVLDNQSGWNSTKFLITDRVVTSLKLQDEIIIAYDGSKLQLFHQEGKNNWKNKLIDSNLGTVSRMLNRFDLDSDTRNRLLFVFHEAQLQSMNNFIVLSSMQESYGKLKIVLNLFLLDSKYNVAQTQQFSFERETIEEIRFPIENEGSTFTIAYDNQNGKFVAKIVNIEGQIVRDIEAISDSEKRSKAEKERLKFLNDDESTKEFLKKSFLIDRSLYQVQISQQGVQIGKDILLRNTGTGWEQESVPSIQTAKLGEHLLLESDNQESNILKFHKKENGNKRLLKQIDISSSGHTVNRFPQYFAYQSDARTVKVLQFKDEKDFGQTLTFQNEQLLPESDWKNLVTFANVSSTTITHSEPTEIRVRPIPNLLSPQPLSFVSVFTLSANGTNRMTGYERTFNKNGTVEWDYNEKVRVIPGNQKNKFGYHEATQIQHFPNGNVTNSENVFDSDGQQVFVPSREKESGESDSSNVDTSRSYLLMDRYGRRVISDFSPYNLTEEMGGYYGFESYESNKIGNQTISGSSTQKRWSITNGEIIRGKFAFTGDSYLHLNSSDTSGLSFLEGVFQPRYQQLTYLAACWARCSERLAMNKPVSVLKAVISTVSGEEIIGLLGQVKRQLGDWYYLELPLDFQMIRQIYRDYVFANSNGTETLAVGNNSSVAFSQLKIPKFQIAYRVEAPQKQTVDIDHIRFSPFTHDFEAHVYDSHSGKPSALIKANGLVTRTIYNRLHQKMASIDEDGQVEKFSTFSKTAKMVPSPGGSVIHSKPSSVTIEPEWGMYESFDPGNCRERWNINEQAVWNIASGKLWHNSSGKHRIQTAADLFSKNNFAFRCFFVLDETNSSLEFQWVPGRKFKLSRQSNHSSNLELPNGRRIASLTSSAELVIMLDDNFVFIWINGVLFVDEEMSIRNSNQQASFFLEAQGKVLVEDIFVLNEPKVKVDYMNGFGEVSQVIEMEDANNAIVHETLYDEIGREAIMTKSTRVSRQAGQPLLHYRENFARNKYPSDSQSVWNTGRLEGEVGDLNPEDVGFPYSRTEYASNPLNEEKGQGLPGNQFSLAGPYAVRRNRDSNVDFIHVLFPTREGYRQEVEYVQNGSMKITIFNSLNLQVAKYVRVPGYSHLLSTFEYNEDKRLVKILPPLYHVEVNTAGQLTPWKSGDEHLSVTEKQWQDRLATRFNYDKFGYLIQKITPDTGTTEYLYNSAGQKRFMVSMNSTSQPETIVYFNYDEKDQLVGTGHIKRPLSLSELRAYLKTDKIPYDDKYQQFDYADNHPNPVFRGRVRSIVTHNDDGETLAEKLHFDGKEQISEKTTFSTTGKIESHNLSKFKRVHKSGKVHTLEYPVKIDGKPIRIIHSYNKLGQLVALGNENDSNSFATFTYHGSGHLATENYQPSGPHSFARQYSYNSPGFLEKISDLFLSEEISYTEKGYGQEGYGDGMVMHTSFNATWYGFSDGRWFIIGENDLGGNSSIVCISALKRIGYLTDRGRPIKELVGDLETQLPAQCHGETGKMLTKLVAEKQTPGFYGFSFSYDSHQALTKAKYFTGENEKNVKPFQPNSFARDISGLTAQQSQNIWQILVNTGYIIVDQSDPDRIYGKLGDQFGLSVTKLHNDLATLNDDYKIYTSSIKRLILAAFSQRRAISSSEFETTFLHWTGLMDMESPNLLINQKKEAAGRIYSMLAEKRYLSTRSTDSLRALDPNFVSALQQYNNFLPEIVKVLTKHFANALGKSPFDLESYDIDANGNHRHFYSGFDSYELEYKNGTNRIQNVKVNHPGSSGTGNRFPMKHDNQGNVIQALHKNIERIEYHPVSQRTTGIVLTNGHSLRFQYDAQGERVSKRVFDANGKLLKEKYYLRDEGGRVLVDKEINHLPKFTQEFVTVYIYGPRGLLGFLRNNEFYVVTTDHLGSTRLIIHNGQVVAAYDYMPYGQLMRSFGNDPTVKIAYLFTGQEWDEETGLYNFHARFYDPTIGRFYQVDPKAQYFSPYKYAGNSPLSIVDPDGEFAFTLMVIGLALAGAYLGGAAMNDNWNPVKWDYKSGKTWLGIIGGGIAGGMMPVGFAASAAVIGVGGTIALGAGGAYLTTAAANQNWNPLEWKWDRPHTYNALFSGFGTGSGIAGGIGVVHSFANKGQALISLSSFIGVSHTTGKAIFLTVSYTVGIGAAYGSGVMANKGNAAFWEWDWKNPGTYSALIDGFDSGTGWPQNFMEMGRGISKIAKNPKRLLGVMGKGAKSGGFKQSIKSILKNPQHPLYKVSVGVVMAYFMGSSANGEFDITKWDLSSYSTYEGVLNGIFFGKDAHNMLKLARQSKTKPQASLSPSLKSKGRKWVKKLGSIIDDILSIRKNFEYSRLVERSFTPEIATVLLAKLQSDGKLSSTIKDVDTFLKSDAQAWKNGERNPPEALKKLLSDEANQNVQKLSEDLGKWGKDTDDISKTQQEVFPDKDVDYLNCRRLGARKKRSVFSLFSCKVPIPSKEFKDNPVAFFDKHAVSTLKTFDKFKFGDSKITLENGKVYDFGLEKAHGGEYHLAATSADDPNVIKGYWLATSKAGEFADPSATIRVDAFNPEGRFIFTGELQGCSVCIKYDALSDTLEVFHYNRPGLKSVYINEFKGSEIAPGRNKYISEVAENIPELANAVLIKDVNGNIIHGKDNTIVIDQPLYKELANGVTERIATINGKPIDELISANQNLMLNEQALKEKYDVVIEHEQYLGHPENYPLLMRQYKISKTVTTPFLYMNSNNEWTFVSQKITYPPLDMSNPHGQVEGFTLEQGGLHQAPISTEVQVETVTIPIAAYIPQLRIKDKFKLPSDPILISKLPSLKDRSKRSADNECPIDEDAPTFNNATCEIHTDSSLETKSILGNDDADFEGASSGAGRVHFWPIDLVKILTAATASYFSSEVIQDLQMTADEYPGGESSESLKAGPTVLEMGDEWLGKTESNGFLSWGILFARKMTGYKPKASKRSYYNGVGTSVEMDVRAGILADQFIDSVLEHADVVGIKDAMSELLNTPEFYGRCVGMMREKLASGQLEILPQLLYKKLVEGKVKNICARLSDNDKDNIFVSMGRCIDGMREKFLLREQEWLVQDYNGSEETECGRPDANILVDDCVYQETANTKHCVAQKFQMESIPSGVCSQ